MKSLGHGQYKATRSMRDASRTICFNVVTCTLQTGLLLCFGHCLIASRSLILAAESVIVTDIDGERTTATLKQFAAERLVIETDAPREIPRSHIRSLELEHPIIRQSGGESLIWLANGDRIAARAVDIKNDSLSIIWPLIEPDSIAPIPLERVSAVIFDMPASMGDRIRLFADLETLPSGNDVVMLLNGDRTIGEVQQLDASFLELKSGNSVLKLDRSRVRALRMNPELTNATRNAGRRAILTLTDGSRLTATTLEATDEVLSLKSSAANKLNLFWKDVHSCHFYGDRIIPLSDYEPKKVELTPYLSTTWPLVRNANVRYGPLMLRGAQFVSGLGTHSRSSITYNLKGHEQQFETVVGIDDIANGSGSVIFAIAVDDEQVWTSPEITGKTAPLNVPVISLNGKKQLTLVVEFGQYADVSDYADWCDPVLILNADR